MIITRSPLRVSFAGGGTDIPAFYKKYEPGVVVSTSINRYVYVTVNQKFDGKVSVRYRVHEMVDSVSELKHPLIRECLLHYGIEKGIEIVISSEVPARGSGLGASSALACALCLALSRFVGEPLDEAVTNPKNHIAGRAAYIEINKCFSPIGKQDHYASAFGGLNLIKFFADDSVEVTPYAEDDFYREIEAQSMLFYLDIEHEYHAAEGDKTGRSFVQKILRDQVAEVDEKAHTHILQRDNALNLWANMEYAVPERFMDHINENWRLKRNVHQDISNKKIDAIVDRAYAAGATAAKVCGAGGGGFLYLMVPPSMQDSVREELSELNELKFGFEQKGTQCIFEEKENYAPRPSAG
jgi:D-glycero-alpha-D-manno-heptose-7-phosphate kinase